MNKIPNEVGLSREEVEQVLNWSEEDSDHTFSVWDSFGSFTPAEYGYFNFGYSVHKNSAFSIDKLTETLNKLVQSVATKYDVVLKIDFDKCVSIEIDEVGWLYVTAGYNQMIDPNELPPLDFSAIKMVTYNSDTDSFDQEEPSPLDFDTTCLGWKLKRRSN